MIKYLSEIKTEFENVLSWWSGAQFGSNNEQNEVEIIVTLSL